MQIGLRHLNFANISVWKQAYPALSVLNMIHWKIKYREKLEYEKMTIYALPGGRVVGEACITVMSQYRIQIIFQSKQKTLEWGEAVHCCIIITILSAVCKYMVVKSEGKKTNPEYNKKKNISCF